MNQGSKLVVAAAGPERRTLPVGIDSRIKIPAGLGFRNPRVVLPGILVVEGPAFRTPELGAEAMEKFVASYNHSDAINSFPLIVVADESEFTARTLNNFLWVAFTRSNPAVDLYGIESFTVHKHWGCQGSLVIDARTKPHHAPPLVEDPAVTKKVDELAAPGKPLHGVI